MNYPCKDCTERTVGCHSTCEKYLSVKNVYKAETSMINKAKAEQDNFDDYKVRAVTATKKRFGQKGGGSNG